MNESGVVTNPEVITIPLPFKCKGVVEVAEIGGVWWWGKEAGCRTGSCSSPCSDHAPQPTREAAILMAKREILDHLKSGADDLPKRALPAYRKAMAALEADIKSRVLNQVVTKPAKLVKARVQKSRPAAVPTGRVPVTIVTGGSGLPKGDLKFGYLGFKEVPFRPCAWCEACEKWAPNGVCAKCGASTAKMEVRNRPYSLDGTFPASISRKKIEGKTYLYLQWREHSGNVKGNIGIRSKFLGKEE